MAVSQALCHSFMSINSLARSLKEIALLHDVKEESTESQSIPIEMRSLEIATDALEIIVRALHLNTGQESFIDDSITGCPEKTAENLNTEIIPPSETTETKKIVAHKAERNDETSPLVLEHPPIIYKEIVKDDPPITLFRKFLSDFEVKYLIKKAEGMWIPSLTGKVDDMDRLKDAECPMELLKVSKSENRTSWSCVMDVDDPVVKLIVDRVSFISGYPPEHVERLSLVRYEPEPGQYSRMHHDGVFRLTTVFIYLNDLPEDDDGETYFPRLGIKFTPTQGLAVMWNNTLPDGSADQRVVHAGLAPRTVAKFGANCFINRSPRTYKPPDTETCVH